MRARWYKCRCASPLENGAAHKIRVKNKKGALIFVQVNFGREVNHPDLDSYLYWAARMQAKTNKGNILRRL